MTTLTASATIGDRFAAGSGRFPLSGVQALIRLIVDVRRADLAQGLDTAAFVSGYEGSPLAGLDLELQRREQLLAEHDIVFRPAVNEELAATAVQGTQLVAGHEDARVAGITGFWYGKSPGVDRASDALRHANLIGTHPRGGAVAFVGDDPAAKSSTVPGASEFLLADLGMPVLYPADPQDIVDLGRHAVAMSRASGLWVALKIVATVADGVGLVEADPGRVTPAAHHGRPFAHQPNARMLQPALSEMERSREGIRREVAIAYARANSVNRVENFGAAPRTGIVAGGKTYLELRQALRIIGLDEAELSARGMRLLHLGMIHPLIPDQIEEFAAGLDEIIVVEEKRPFVESAVKQILYGRPDAPRVSGRGHAGEPLFPPEGELDADLIARGLAERLGGPQFPTVDTWRARTTKPRPVTQLPLVARTPYFCSGCPHNSSTKAPAGSMVGGGIGCHALVLMMEPNAVGEVIGLTQMGGEGAQWIGMEPFLRTRKHLLQNIGDGTFHHSGSLAVRAAIASGADITYKLLYNSAVAMTGGQDAVGAMAIPALTRALAAEGVRRIIVTTGEPRRYRQRSFRLRHGRLAGIAEVWPRDRLAEAQQALSSVHGVTVLIHDQECATELRRKRKRGKAPEPPQHVVINERVCEGCGDCGQQSNCLSVQPVDTDFGRKTTIDQSSCNKDFSCLAGDCPAFVEVRPAGTRSRRRTAAPLGAADLPAPAARFDVDAAPHTTRITGVGGTGIVTVSQILAAAAGFAGREVRTLDQIGLAQKGGAVVSDVKISASPLPAASKAAAGECDLYLGCDLLVAADPKNLTAADAARTVAVVSTTKVPTGRMVTDPGSAFPDVDAIAGQIRRAAGGRDPILLDARRLAVTLLGTDQFANMLLVGAAYQAGALPLPAEAIEQAVGLERSRGRRQPAGVPPRPAGGRRPGRFCRGRGRPDGQARGPSRRRGRGAAGGAGRGARGLGAGPAGPRPDRRPGRLPEPALCRRLRRARPARLPGRARRRPGQHRAVRTGRALPVQAHGLQGRVRGGPAVPRPAARRDGRGRVRARRHGELPASPAGPAGPGPAPQDPSRPLVQAGLWAAGGDEGPARHAFRPVRPYSCPPPRARAGHRVPRGRGGPARPPDRGHPGRLRPHRGPARPGPRLRADQDRQRRSLPRAAARRPGRAADRGRSPWLADARLACPGRRC